MLKEWREPIKASKLIFVRATGSNRNTVFFDDAILKSQDERIRSFPFTTKRPTFSELERCFSELVTVKISSGIVDTVEVKASKVHEPERPKTHLQFTPEQQSEAPLSSFQEKLIEYIKKGKLPQVKSLITSLPECASVNKALGDSNGVTYLHIASAHGEADIVEYLLSVGADITIKGKVSRPYDVADSKETRDVFRRFMASYPLKWDYKLANVPGPLTPEMEEKQREKDLERRKKEKEKKKSREKEAPPIEIASISSTVKRLNAVKLSKTDKQAIGISPEQRMRLDREKR